MDQVVHSLKKCVTECNPLHRIQGLKQLFGFQRMCSSLVAALAYFHDTSTFATDFHAIHQIEERLFNEGLLDTYLALLESGIPAQYHWLDAELEVRDVREARLVTLLSHLKGGSHGQGRAIDMLISSNDLDWIKRHIQIIHPLAGKAQKKAIARLFVANGHHEELLSRVLHS